MNPQAQHGIGMTSARTRARLIARLRASGIVDERTLKAMGEVPRHLFVDEALASRAYEDDALPIGQHQTISQPYIVARMTEALLGPGPQPPQRVLEVGTGSGYQTAVLCALVPEVFSVERVASFVPAARRRLQQVGARNFRLHHGDGAMGWLQHAPFDAVIVTAAASEIPPALMQQLAVGGRLVVPVGTEVQQLLLLRCTAPGSFETEQLGEVRFVPLVRS